MKLHISSTLALPLESVTQTFAILGIRGSGKTNTAVCLMEEMLKANQQCVVLDPTNAWYGIRSSQDGKSAGFQVYVFGGPNGDIPLEGSHGPTMADFVVETGASVVFSLRHLSMNDQRNFAMGFGERLHHLKGRSEYQTPLCLFLDEADEFIPQRIPHGYERMFGAYDRLVRRDRNCGLGVVLISQRPQVINKDTLSQIETLICHRLLHKLDRKSVKEAWVEGHDIANKSDEFFGSLASLSKGDAWIWSPEWLDIFQRVHIRHRETFDSSATPKAGERPKIAHKLAEVDLDVLKKKLASTIEKSKADDPRELRRQIADLTRQLAQRPSTVVPKEIEKVVEVKVPIWTPDQIASLTQAADAIVSATDWIRTLSAQPRRPAMPSRLPASKSLLAPRRPITEPVMNGNLRDGARRMLAALCQFSPAGMPEGRLRSHAGLKKSGTYTTYKSDLLRSGLIEKRGDELFATQSGLDYFGDAVPVAPTTTEEVLAIWNPKLREGARRMLQVLIAHQGRPVTREDLYSESNLAKSGTAATYLSNLRRAQLITVSGEGVAANVETLFL